MSSTYNTDRNLLFGVLAVQMDFINKESLLQAMQSWVFQKHQPLGQILESQGALAADCRQLLEALVEKHLQQHENNPEKSLAAISSATSVRQELAEVPDADVQASLASMPTLAKLSDPNTTRALPSLGGNGTPQERFRILRPHAQGGLGEVFVAQDQELGREVALKAIQDRYADHPESRSRFLLEAEVTGKLEHPSIVPVYGLGQYADGRPFYAMRFIRGDSLKDAIERFHQTDGASPLAGERMLEFRKLLGRFIDVCNAMEYAHSRGVLHRDLKPGNIMLGKYGETLVVDWGLAKPVGHAEKRANHLESTLLPASGEGSSFTLAGQALGTPAFMSPEQAAGKLDQLGPVSDVYSLGATLYCLLTGKAPFQDSDVGLVLSKVQMGEFARPRQVQPNAPKALEAICLKAMALKPSDRYGSVRELADEIEHWLGDEPVRAYREPLRVRARRWCGHHPAQAIWLAVLIIWDLLLIAAVVGAQSLGGSNAIPAVQLVVDVFAIFCVVAFIIAFCVQVLAISFGLLFFLARALFRGRSLHSSTRFLWKGLKFGAMVGTLIGYVFGWILFVFFWKTPWSLGGLAVGCPILGSVLACCARRNAQSLLARVTRGAALGAFIGSLITSSWWTWSTTRTNLQSRSDVAGFHLGVRPTMSGPLRICQKDQYGGRTKEGTDYWMFTVYLDGPTEQLRDIQMVTYHLHSTYPNPDVEVRGTRENGFALTRYAWGTFTVRATVQMPEQKIELETELKFKDSPVPNKQDAGRKLAK